jgi:hypothetical protein
MDENKTVSSMITRAKSNKESPINSWTVNYDKDTDEPVNNEYEIMLNNFLEVQKQSRLEAKRISESQKLKNKPIYVDPLLFWKNNEIKFIQLSRLAKPF